MQMDYGHPPQTLEMARHTNRKARLARMNSYQKFESPNPPKLRPYAGKPSNYIRAMNPPPSPPPPPPPPPANDSAPPPLFPLPESTFMADPEQKRPVTPVPTISLVKGVVAKEYRVSVVDMESERREMRLVLARHIAVYLICMMSRRSYPAIGRAFGDRDHTTILHARRRIERMTSADPVFADKIEWLRAAIVARMNGEPIDQCVGPIPDGKSYSEHVE